MSGGREGGRELERGEKVEAFLCWKDASWKQNWNIPEDLQALVFVFWFWTLAVESGGGKVFLQSHTMGDCVIESRARATIERIDDWAG